MTTSAASKPRRIHPGVAGLLVILVLLGVGCLALGCHLKGKVEAVKSWTAVDAVITKSGTVPLRTKDPVSGNWVDSEQAQIGFKYTVAGRTYEGSRFNGQSSVPPSGSLEKYPEGAQVQVYYDPANPSDAVLTNDTSYGFGVFFFFAFGIFVLFAASIVGYFVLGARTAASH